jgi:hypothetical protein
MEAEEVERLGAHGEMHDPGLLRVQSQPDRIQYRRDLVRAVQVPGCRRADSDRPLETNSDKLRHLDALAAVHALLREIAEQRR